MFPSWLPFPFRVFIAVATRTFFQPDEFFQALEPAHHAVFGFGSLTWEWVAKPPIRSVAYPALWMPVYYVLKITSTDNSRSLVVAPKVIAGLFAALTDVYVGKLAARVLGSTHYSVAVLVSLSSVFHTLALSRTLSNSLETSLTTIALYHWPLPGNHASRYPLSLFLAGITFLIRPTSAITWSFLGLEMFVRFWLTKRPLLPLVLPLLALGILFLLVLLGIDSAYFGEPTFTPLNFFRVNLSSVSSFYGVNASHYYVTQAIPVLCGTSLPFMVHGMWLAYNARGDSARTLRILMALCLWTTAVYSLTGHKEWRFIHPLLPIFHLFSTKSLVHLAFRSDRDSPRPTSRSSLGIRRAHLAILLCTIPASVYVVLFHSRAQIAVMDYLRDVPAGRFRSVGFLMPCHSTPGQAHLHRLSVEMWAIGCEPPLNVPSAASYKDQTTAFYDDPVSYVKLRFPAKVDAGFPRSPLPSSPAGNSSRANWIHSWPSHLVTFGSLTKKHPELEGIFRGKGYDISWYSSNGWEEDDRRRGGIMVWEWSGKAIE